METEKTVSPELIKAAYEIALPHLPESLTQPAWAADYFNPLINDTELKALMLALMGADWRFWYSDEKYRAYHPTVAWDDPDNESFALLLLKAVSAQSGLPMYLEDIE